MSNNNQMVCDPIIPELKLEVVRLSSRVQVLQGRVNEQVDTIASLKSEMKGGGKLTTLVQQAEHEKEQMRLQVNAHITKSGRLETELARVQNLLKKQIY